jgi:hypothetical protein
LIDPVSVRGWGSRGQAAPLVQREGETAAPAAGGEAPGGEALPGGAGGETVSLEQQVRDALAGESPDTDVPYLIGWAPEGDRWRLLNNGLLLWAMRNRLGDGARLDVAQSLARDLDIADRVRVAEAFYDLSTAPAGKIRQATGLLMLSDEEVDRNTADRILNGDITVQYIEDLSQPPNVNNLLAGYGYDPAVWTFYYRPGSTINVIWVQLNAVGFRIIGSNIICGFRRLPLERWQTLLVHETNHARNPDPTTPLLNYQSEFRAYWVAEYREVEDLEERANLIKAHVLADYPGISAVYNTDETVRNAIDAYTRPTGNITNI